ncbi:GTA baseplate fiber-binding domain-containing protein [Aurantiacibacter sp. D1-12]|uniref:GTA baseplate fiber-binding domain-containing protein n=1 Tax=Aurantiacibacter sp. D1-12 TaxID=2993658 RepID=UPI00237CD907|nr:phage tail protein [Aurantiacibacter sp. D1-12]MDE1468573.1 phage tail protein [Aurantiacibacter sp. D1-12]
MSLTELLRPLPGDIAVDRPLPSLEGYSDEGGALVETLGSIDRIYPIASNADGIALAFTSSDPDDNPEIALPEPVVDPSGDGFGGGEGRTERTSADETRIPAGIRYYDIDRDYQVGMQRAGGRATPGRNRLIEFPGAMRASSARLLADGAAERARWAQDRLAYRIAEIDPELKPGQVVSVPGKSGKWRIEAWEWRENGVELELLRLPHRKGVEATTEGGRSLPQLDLLASPTLLEAFELPWDGTGASNQPQVFAAASSVTSGWRGAALYALIGSRLIPIGNTGSRRSVIGTLETAISAARTVLIDRHTQVIVQLVSDDLSLDSGSIEELADGRNRALLGGEIIQFAKAQDLGSGRWQLSTLLRGRGATEHAAHAGHAAGSNFVLLDDHPVLLDSDTLGAATQIAAIGLAETEPVADAIEGRGTTLQPLSPVRANVTTLPGGSMTLRWTRRARGVWTWESTVETPLVEQAELYEVGIGDPDTPSLTWEVSSPGLEISAATAAQLLIDHAGSSVWVRQIGTHARSIPLFLTTIA